MHWRRYLHDPALAPFAAVERGPARMLVRRGLEAHAPALGLHGDPTSASRVHGGRATHPVVALADGVRAVVRRYHRGGAIRHVNRWTYFAGHRAFHELLATERARAAGVRAPQVLAATEARSGVGYTAWLATRMIDGAVESAAWLASAGAEARRAMLREAGRQISRMHAAGIAHPDLNLRNLLVVDGSIAEDRSTGDRSADALAPAATAADRSTESTSAVQGRSTAARQLDAPRTVGPTAVDQPTDTIPSPDRSADDEDRRPADGHPSTDTPSEAVESEEAADGAGIVVYVIDFDGARLYEGGGVPGGRRAADLRRLARSARKLRAAIGAEGWAAVREGYGAGAWPLSADETRDLG